MARRFTSILRRLLVDALSLLGLLALILPATLVFTIMLFPLWWWIEDAFGIESVGHSGPAEWCYVLVFAVLVVTVIPGFWLLRRRHRQGLLMAKAR